MDGGADHATIFEAFDGRPVPRSWWADLCTALLGLEASIALVDRPILSPLVAHLARHGNTLRTHASSRPVVKRPTQIVDTHPGSATLFSLRDTQVLGLRPLIHIGLCALLDAGVGGRGRPERLLQMVRGALDSNGSELYGVLGAARTIPELLRAADSAASQGSLPVGFAGIWSSWLRDTLLRWMRRDPSRLRLALEPVVLLPQPDDPYIPVLTEPEAPDSALILGNTSTPASTDAESVSTVYRVARAASDSLDRASIGDLLIAAELRLPAPLDEHLCRESVRRAYDLVSTAPDTTESYVALALLLAGGIREIDLGGVVWGGEQAASPHSIDPVVPLLYRRIKLPAHAVRPDEGLSDWLQRTTDVLAWPLPPAVHQLLLMLQGSPREGQAVLPLLGQSPARPYSLHAVIDALVPSAKVGALAPRAALASRIAAKLGSEMAQLAMADTFGVPPVPAYYSAMPEHDLAKVIAQIQSQRFGEPVTAPMGRHHHVGSRLVLTPDAAKQWPRLLRERIKAASRQQDDVLAQWRASRDHLVAALCCATGHRPENALGKIHLGDVIPEYGLILLQDKQVDALRTTRVAATGRLWLSELRRYLDFLIKVAEPEGRAPGGDLAASILRNEMPLFSLSAPDGTVVPMTVGQMREGMPLELRSVDNFYRHRLNQRLLEDNFLKGRVDPELRHAQLGWVVSPAHLHSDLSPRAPVSLATGLGQCIDDILTADGWDLPSDRKTRWTWDGVPLPALVDWDAEFATQQRTQDEALKQVRRQIQEKWKKVEGPVLARMAEAFRTYCPLLQVDLLKKRLVHEIEGGRGVELNADHHGLICDHVRQGDEEPSSGLEAVVARILLYRLVRRARDTGLVLGPIPGRPYLSITTEPSPFVPGLGIAVRHAHWIRDSLEARARTKSERDLAQLTAWSILAFSIYRRIPWAQAATGAAKTAMRAQNRPHVLRVDTRVGEGRMHMVFSGIPATLLARRKRHAPTSPAPTEASLAQWAVTHLSHGLEGAASPLLAAALSAAGQIELSGIERCLVRAGPQTAAERHSRCIARDDGWPVHTVDHLADRTAISAVEPPVTEISASITQGDQRANYLRFVGLLNKHVFARGRAAKAAGASSASDGHRGWRQVLRKRLEELRSGVGAESNLSILIGYTLDHLRYGSEDGNRLSQASLRREITQFAPPLLSLMGGQSLISLQADELLSLYRTILFGKSVEARPYALEELRRFHRFLVRVHACPAVDMAELAGIAGERRAAIEPGLLTGAERRLVFDELRRDEEQETSRPDASPEFLHLARLRQIYFLVLDASGIRPGSAYGLTLGDVHLFDGRGDYVHVRKGTYGEAKTRTSLGFVPLAGSLWGEHRDWLSQWIEGQRQRHLDVWSEIPLFAAHGEQRIRVHDHHLTSRINELLKWATGDRRARCYWLRKTRISERFHSLSWGEGKSARDVYGLLAASGHAWIQTTMESYINDPAPLLLVEDLSAVKSTRPMLIAISGLAASLLDTAWSRAGKGGTIRIATLLDRIEAEVAAPQDEHLVPPPMLRRRKPIRPLHVDQYARARQRTSSQTEAALAAGITLRQAQDLDRAASELFDLRGQAPWQVTNTPLTGHVLMPARKLHGTGPLFALLESAPCTEVTALVQSWARQCFAARQHGPNVIMSVEPAQRPTVQHLIADKESKLQLVHKGDSVLLVEVPGTPPGKGHGSALRWVFSIAWVFSGALAVRC